MIGDGTGSEFRAKLTEQIVELKDFIAVDAQTLAERIKRNEAQNKLRELQRELGIRATDRKTNGTS